MIDHVRSVIPGVCKWQKIYLFLVIFFILRRRWYFYFLKEGKYIKVKLQNDFNAIFQQDGAPPYSSLNVRNIVYEKFGNW